jgi:multidrug resistance efflux pump
MKMTLCKIHVGDKAIVEVDAYLKKEFEGQVTEIKHSHRITYSRSSNQF